MDKQLRGQCANRTDHAPDPGRKRSKIPGKFGDDASDFAFLPGFLQIGSEDMPGRDCLSNRLRKTRRAFLQAPASKPTCAIEHFFHT
ncbi:hypothetical protein [Burkholderia sp. PU8-34]